MLLVHAELVLGQTVRLLDESRDPEQQDYKDQIVKAVDSYVASTLRQSILFDETIGDRLVYSTKRIGTTTVLTFICPWRFASTSQPRTLPYVPHQSRTVLVSECSNAETARQRVSFGSQLAFSTRLAGHHIHQRASLLFSRIVMNCSSTLCGPLTCPHKTSNAGHRN